MVEAIEALTFPAPTPEQLAEAEQCEAKAERARLNRIRSEAESDTDGFLSQWASGWTDREYRRKAEVLRQGGTEAFTGLYDAAGRRVRARLVDGQWGPVWCVLDSQGRTRDWIPHKVERIGDSTAMRFKARSKGAKLGYRLGYEVAPARVTLDGRGTGLSGQVWVAVYRADGGYPADAVPYEALEGSKA